MKKFLAGFILGVAATFGAMWYYGDHAHAQKVNEDVKGAAVQTKQFVQDKIDSWNLSPESIKDELARTGQVVRSKVQTLGNTLIDATADARTTATIKAKLLADSDLSALSISVSTTAGKVTLSGTVSSPEKIAKAIKLAMSVDGVREVVSTLQIKP
jgi:hyperosmotically inducible protein